MVALCSGYLPSSSESRGYLRIGFVLLKYEEGVIIGYPSTADEDSDGTSDVMVVEYSRWPWGSWLQGEGANRSLGSI